jgi:hypothetical protein
VILGRLAALPALVLGPVLALGLLGGCGGGVPGAAPSPQATPSGPTSTATSTATVTVGPPSARPIPRPARGACYRLTYDEAVAPTSDARPVPCRGTHTTTTYAVGRLDTVVAGHLLAVDSDRAQRQVARTCPRRLGGFLGGDRAALRLSLLRAVWFTPTLEASDAGADWFRCDVVALAGPERLAPLTGRVRGVLGRPDAADRWAMCGTAGPDAADFRRVLCSAPHAWRAVSVVDLGGPRYPGPAVARAAGQRPCEDAGRERAGDPLAFAWGYEWPSREQWEAGMRFGRCWAPD